MSAVGHCRNVSLDGFVADLHRDGSIAAVSIDPTSAISRPDSTANDGDRLRPAHAGLVSLAMLAGHRRKSRPAFGAIFIRFEACTGRIRLRAGRPVKPWLIHGRNQFVDRRMARGRALPVPGKTQEDLATPLRSK